MMAALVSGRAEKQIITQHSIEDFSHQGANTDLQFNAKILLAEDLKTEPGNCQKIYYPTWLYNRNC